jgi:3,4-dihydroxy 2-butanone 4-phosphate synthase/GTP cyclohydrolase II
MITIADLITRTRTESLVKRVASAKMPTDYGDFRIFAFENLIDSSHVALVRGDRRRRDVMVRVHS